VLKSVTPEIVSTGADPTAENETGHRPIAYARSQQLTELLQNYETKVRFPQHL